MILWIKRLGKLYIQKSFDELSTMEMSGLCALTSQQGPILLSVELILRDLPDLESGPT